MSLKVTKIKISDSLTHKIFDYNITKLDIHYEVNSVSGRTVMVNLNNYITNDNLYDKFNRQTLLDIDCKFNQGRFILKKCVIVKYKPQMDSAGSLMENVDMVALDLTITQLKKGMPPIEPFMFR